MPQAPDMEIYHFWTGHEEAPVNALLNAFEKKYGMKIGRNAMEWSVYSMVTKAMLIGGNAPDLMVYDIGQRIRESARIGELSRLDDVWGAEFSKLYPEWVKDACRDGENTYGVPIKRFTFVVWYLKDVFQKYRISPPETWDDFIDICKKFEKAGLPPMVASDWEISMWFENILARTVGQKFYNRLMNGDEKWTDPKVIDAYETLQEMALNYMIPYPFTNSFKESWEILNKREAGMQLQGDWVNGMWRRRYRYAPGKNYDFFPVPPIDKRIGQIMVAGGNAWVIPEKAKNAENARKFLRFAGSVEGQRILVRKGMGLAGSNYVGTENYDAISRRLIEYLDRFPTVLQMDAILPYSVSSVEKLQQMQIVLGQKTKKTEIKRLLSEIDTATDKIKHARE
ncbi:MAG: ABC transporter substrate-binding protein [Candidatus Hadarchaeales archaeon]